MAALDGLRAVAVVAVVAYHASLDQTPGGFFGVDVFFVISGYLVTALFLARSADVRGPGYGDTFDFWRRRFMRLAPAAAGAVLVTWLAFALLNVRSLTELTAEAATALGYVANWFFLFREQSYFETISAPSPFLHFWSLAVEAQFYLVWPVLLIAALRFGGRLSAFALAISLAAISTLVVASLYSPVADPSRAYYGTDARVAGLLLGAALAIVARPALGGIGGRAMRAGVEASGWMGLAILAFMVTRVSEFDPFIYRGGFFIASTATVGVMLAALHGQNSVAWVLSLPPLRWVGERSYSIYLWHWPVFVLTQPQLSIELRSISLLLARLGMTLILAELSYRLVENRFRRGQGLPRGLWRLPRGVPRRLPQVDLGAGPLWRRAWVRPTGVVAAGLVAVLIAGGLPVRSGLADEMAALEASVTAPPAATADATPEHDPTPDQTVARVIDDIAPLPDDDASGDTAPPPAANEDAPPPASTPAGTPPATATSEATPAISTSPASSISSPGGEDHPDDDADADAETGGEPVEADPTPQATLTPDALGATVTVIGDSVMLGAAPDLAAALPGAVVDAEVGRQFWSAPGVIQALRDREALGDVVVIHLGANGPFTDEQFAAVMEALEGVRAVVFVNVTVPRRWQEEVNADLIASTAGLDGVVVADWNALSGAEADFFAADGVHLTGPGRDAYVGLIRDHVAAAVAGMRGSGG